MISEFQGHEEVERDLARFYRMAQLIREVRVLRALMKDMPAVATTACNICFRDFGHTMDSHIHERYYLALLPESRFDIEGFLS